MRSLLVLKLVLLRDFCMPIWFDSVFDTRPYEVVHYIIILRSLFTYSLVPEAKLTHISTGRGPSVRLSRGSDAALRHQSSLTALWCR